MSKQGEGEEGRMTSGKIEKLRGRPWEEISL